MLEHVPDLIGWLREISTILKEKGIASFSIPDRRYTFDYLRAESTVADLLEAYLKKSKKPTIRQRYDHFSMFTEVNVVETWTPYFNGKKLVPTYDINKAYSFCLDAVNNNKYIDTHCWVFTEKSFLYLLTVLSQLNLIDFKIRAFFDVVPNTFEFIVQLEKIPSTLSPEEKHGLFLESLRKVHPHLLRITFKSSSGGVAQIYYDTGKGFNEQESIRKEYSGTEGTIELEFSLPRTNIKRIRFDPLMGPVKFAIINVNLLLAGDEENVVELDSFNPGKNIKRSWKKNGAFFAESKCSTNDPSVIINLPSEAQEQL